MHTKTVYAGRSPEHTRLIEAGELQEAEAPPPCPHDPHTLALPARRLMARLAPCFPAVQEAVKHSASAGVTVEAAEANLATTRERWQAWRDGGEQGDPPALTIETAQIVLDCARIAAEDPHRPGLLIEAGELALGAILGLMISDLRQHYTRGCDLDDFGETILGELEARGYTDAEIGTLRAAAFELVAEAGRAREAGRDRGRFI